MTAVQQPCKLRWSRPWSRPWNRLILSADRTGHRLNNVPVAVAVARQRLGVRRVLVIDWDVHHGNGVQNMFEKVTRRRRLDLLHTAVISGGYF